MGSNKVATVVLFDVSMGMNEITDNEESYFKRSLQCLQKMILRKMFAQDNDEMGIVVFGSDLTNNSLARLGKYRNICIFSHLCLPDWSLIKRINELKVSNIKSSDWTEGLVVALDFLQSESQGKRFRQKHLVIFSTFSDASDLTFENLQPIIDILEGEKINFISIGVDLKDYKAPDSQISNSIDLLFKTVNRIEMAVTYSFCEVEDELFFFEKKRKMKRLSRINLMIGSNIELPVRWMKVTNEETRFKWDVKDEFDQRKPNLSTDTEVKIEFVTDSMKTTNFGGTLVDLSYADLEAMKRKSGPPSFIFLGTVKRKLIPRYMFVGRDVYAIVPDKSLHAQSMFSALIDALIKRERYGLARRVPSKDGKISVGALLPVSEEAGKAMYFLKLPFAEWVQTVPPVKPLVKPDNEKVRKGMRDFIRSCMLPEDLGEEGKGLLLRDPMFQSRCFMLSDTYLNKDADIVQKPSCVYSILKPYTITEDSEDILRDIWKILSPPPRKTYEKENNGLTISEMTPKELIEKLSEEFS